MLQDKRIKTLEVLRGVAFLGVVLSHTGLKYIGSWGHWSVSLFFILNGFLMVHNYYGKNRIGSVSVKDNICFAYRKTRGIYPLHVITMIPFFIRCVAGEDGIINAIVKLILNMLIIQEYVPDMDLNAVSWFLCTLVLSYFIFPWIVKMMEDNYNNRKAAIAIVISIIVELLIGYRGGNTLSISNMGLTDWIIYKHPFSRIWDVIIGYNVGYLFITCRHEFSEKVYTIMEWFSAVLNISVIALSTLNIMHIPLWLRYVLIYTIPTSMLIYSFAVGKGKVSNKLVCKFTMYMAKISPYGFLIHFVIFTLIGMVPYHIHWIKDPAYYNLNYGCWINLSVGLLLTIIASEVWMRISYRVKNSIL